MLLALDVDAVQPGWADGGPGIVAMYVSDARSFGGYDLERYGVHNNRCHVMCKTGEYHGFEDNDFFLRIQYAGLEVVRKREPGIIHHAHPKVSLCGARCLIIGAGRVED